MMQTQKGEPNIFYVCLIVKNNNGSKSKKQAGSSRSGNHTKAEDGKIGKDAAGIGNNVVGTSHDKDNIIECVKLDVHDTEEILNDAKESQVKMKEKHFSFNYENTSNFYDAFVPQTELSPEQEYFSDPSTSNVSSESSSEESDVSPKEMPLLKRCPMRSYVEIKNKEEIERFSKRSKDGDKFCNDVVEVKEKLSNRIVQREKDFAKLDAQSIDFEIALQHKTQENKSLNTVQKNENLLASLQIENAHLKRTYKYLFVSVQSSRIETAPCDEVNNFDMDKIETQNIKLEHQVAILIKDNEHLELVYKNLFDSIKKARF
nr:reverse transcriptase zinc-binding domain-containing protein [Tanacetum cinerariifolium]